MGLEAANFISGLDKTWPTGLDPINKGDDHLRLVKSVLKGQFPGVGGDGYSEAILATEADLNNCVGSTGNFQDQINAAVAIALENQLGVSPIGGVIQYNGTFAGIPANWQLCDGTNGTFDMSDKFVLGTVLEGSLGDGGGSPDSVVVSHQHAEAGVHTHPITDPGHAHPLLLHDENGNNGGRIAVTSSIDNYNGNTQSASTGISVDGDGIHQHAAEGVSGAGANLPPYITLAFIQRIS